MYKNERQEQEALEIRRTIDSINWLFGAAGGIQNRNIRYHDVHDAKEELQEIHAQLNDYLGHKNEGVVSHVARNMNMQMALKNTFNAAQVAFSFCEHVNNVGAAMIHTVAHMYLASGDTCLHYDESQEEGYTCFTNMVGSYYLKNVTPNDKNAEARAEIFAAVKHSNQKMLGKDIDNKTRKTGINIVTDLVKGIQEKNADALLNAAKQCKDFKDSPVGFYQNFGDVMEHRITAFTTKVIAKNDAEKAQVILKEFSGPVVV